MRGRKPSLRLARADRPGGVDVDAPGPIPPPELDAEARVEWERIVSYMPVSVLTVLDTGMLALYCSSYTKWRAAEAAVERDGPVVILRSDKGEVKSLAVNPMLNAANKYAALAVKCAAELGLSPTARARLRMPDKRPATKLIQMITKRGAGGAA